MRNWNFHLGTDGGTTSHYVFNQARFESKDCDLDEANGYTFPVDVWNGTRGIDNYGYVFSEDYPFIMPGYFGAELHPVMALTGTGVSSSIGLTAFCVVIAISFGREMEAGSGRRNEF